jgi:hypothetical protein
MAPRKEWVKSYKDICKLMSNGYGIQKLIGENKRQKIPNRVK